MRTIKNLLKGLCLMLLASYINHYFNREVRMERKRLDMPRWIAVALFILGLYILFGAPACVRVAPLTEVVYLEDDPWGCKDNGFCTVAETACSEQNHPVIIIRKSEPDSAKEYTKIHEEVHLNQLKKDCHGTMKMYRDSVKVRVKMESEAYCAESRQMWLDTHNAVLATNYYYGMMNGLYAGEKFNCDLLRGSP